MPHFGELSGFATTAYGVASASAWSPTDKDPDMVLSNGNRTATITAANGAVRGTRSRSSGKYMLELRPNDDIVTVALARSTAGITVYPGVDANAYAYYGGNGNLYNGGAGIVYGATFGVGDVIGVLYDNGNIYFYKNGVNQGLAFSGVVGALFPMFGPATAGAGTRSCFINTGQEPFLYPVAGYSPWG